MTIFPNQRHASLSADDPWWKSAVVYQVYPRSFADTNGDGIGDVPGIIEKLDYLAELGIDVLWLSPIFTSPQDDNGYDISNYQDIDPMFGTLADVDRLIAAAHDRGIKIVMDLVVNHSSDEHPWFVESRSSTDNPKRDWYWWRPAREGTTAGEPGAEPTNWRSFFSGSVWELDETTGEYYLHLFSKKQPDLNWENPEVRAAVYEMMNWWLDRGVDGFRMDVINLLSKMLPMPESDMVGPDGYAPGFQYFMNGPRIHEFLKEMYQEVFAGRDRMITVGETPGASTENARVYTNPAELELDMIFQFEHMSIDRGLDRYHILDLDLRALKASLAHWQYELQDVGWNSLYWNNHDQPRVVSRFGNDGEYRVESAKLLGAVLHMMQGTPYIYQGEEFGMTNYPFAALDQYQDIEVRNYAAVAATLPEYNEAELLKGLAESSRDHARTPVQWDNSPTAGFTTGEPWLPVNPNAGTVNASQAVADQDSVFHFYRKLIALRHELPIVVHGRFDLLLEEDEQVFAFTRTLGSEQLLVLANFGDEVIDVALEDASEWAAQPLLIGNYSVGTQTGDLTLRPWETRVYHRN